MSKLKVENFGPITTGFTEDDGFMDFRKVTVFIGNQGSGKSSVAKLFSTMSWLEKALFRGWIKPEDITRKGEFINRCHYLNLKSYFQGDTLLEYQGKAFSFSFINKKLTVSSNGLTTGYQVPKIMYVPAERNFLTAVDNPSELKGIPKALSDFWNELSRAQRELKGALDLPIGNASFKYNKTQKTSQIVREKGMSRSYNLLLSDASSGFQSFVPLFLVSRSLALSTNKERDDSKSELSGDELVRLQDETNQIMSNPRLSAEVRQSALEALSAKFKYGAFLNIVEEPEQNLFPTSQQTMLYKLLEYAHASAGNELVITTHSPYVVNYLTLAIKGEEVLRKIKALPEQEGQLAQLNKIVPAASVVAGSDTIVYELTEAGEILRLATYHGLPSDNNYLNRQLEETNNLFADLLDLEAIL